MSILLRIFNSAVHIIGLPTVLRIPRGLGLLLSLMVLSLIGFACGINNPRPIEKLLPINEVRVPTGTYFNMAWYMATRLLVRYEPDQDSSNWTRRLWLLDLTNGAIKMLEVPLDPAQNCFVIFYLRPVMLPDGRIAFERGCSNNQGKDEHIMVFDPKTYAIGLLYPYMLPAGSITMSNAPDLSRTVVSSNTRIKDRIWVLDSSGPKLLELGLDRANTPAWSPDGGLLAFIGNENLPGSPGPNWVGAPYDLFLLPTDCLEQPQECSSELKRIIHGIQNPGSLNWSPDGKWLVFDGSLPGSEEGIYLVDVVSQEVYQVAIGGYGSPTWSPDGKRIMVTAPRVTTEGDFLGYRPGLFVIDFSQFPQQ